MIKWLAKFQQLYGLYMLGFFGLLFIVMGVVGELKGLPTFNHIDRHTGNNLDTPYFILIFIGTLFLLFLCIRPLWIMRKK